MSLGYEQYAELFPKLGGFNEDEFNQGVVVGYQEPYVLVEYRASLVIKEFDLVDREWGEKITRS